MVLCALAFPPSLPSFSCAVWTLGFLLGPSACLACADACMGEQGKACVVQEGPPVGSWRWGGGYGTGQGNVHVAGVVFVTAVI